MGVVAKNFGGARNYERPKKAKTNAWTITYRDMERRKGKAGRSAK